MWYVLGGIGDNSLRTSERKRIFRRKMSFKDINEAISKENVRLTGVIAELEAANMAYKKGLDIALAGLVTAILFCLVLLFYACFGGVV